MMKYGSFKNFADFRKHASEFSIEFSKVISIQKEKSIIRNGIIDQSFDNHLFIFKQAHDMFH